MAYAALVSLAQTIDQILNDHRYSISPDEKQQIIDIHNFVILLQVFLENFGEKSSSLEARIADVANEAEDIIEYFMLEQIGWSEWMLGFSKSMAKQNLRDRLRKSIVQDFESIAGEAMDIQNRITDMPVRITDFTAAATSSRLAPTGKDEMVGFSDDLIAIKGRLCGGSSKLQVIPIFGMGGIGKTALARNAYDDPLTMQYFDIRVWVTISQDYTVPEILSSLLDSMKLLKEEGSKQGNESIMAQKAYQNLKGRRYLIVMDDMWSTKAWDDVMMVFPDDYNGSRIMLTTRLSDVAAYPDASSPLHEMRFMNEDQSWDLLKQKVFKQETCPPELTDIAKDIARSCRGLPLAIVVIAGLLSTMSRTRASWGKIAADVNSAVATKDGQLEKILSLSYTHLPHHLRPYFLYMGAFPEDHKICVLRLIRLWVAEGFSRLNGSKSYEEVAEDCLEELVKRSLVLVTKRKSNGKIKYCGMHDLVRELCIRKAKEEKFLLHIMDRFSDTLVQEPVRLDRRRIIITRCLRRFEDVNGSRTRTLMCIQKGGISLDYSNHRLLRVLDNKESPSPEFSQLFHLRYLHIQFPIEIPAAISKLQNLQTLVICHSPFDRFFEEGNPRARLPVEIWSMPQLRHLEFYGYLPSPERAAFALENLQTLSRTIDLICTNKILKMIPNLKKFVLEFHENQDFYLDNLVHLHQLEELTLQDYSRRQHSLAFPRSLKKITLFGCRHIWKDITLVGSLPNLEVLKLKSCACEVDKWETTEGQFLQLKVLIICGSDLQDWRTESSHFPSLKYLLLYDCWRLSEIPDSIAEIPTLELIEVKGENRSLLDSAKRIQEEQQSFGNDSLQVRCMHDPYALYKQGRF